MEGISVGDAAYGAVPVGSAGSWAEYVNVKVFIECVSRECVCVCARVMFVATKQQSG